MHFYLIIVQSSVNHKEILEKVMKAKYFLYKIIINKLFYFHDKCKLNINISVLSNFANILTKELYFAVKSINSQH